MFRRLVSLQPALPRGLPAAGSGGFFFGALLGIPPDLAEAPYDDIHDDPRFQFMIDLTDTTKWLPSCTSAVVEATPAPRVVDLAQAFESCAPGRECRPAVTDLESICDGNLETPMRRLAAKIGLLAAVLRPRSAPRPLASSSVRYAYRFPPQRRARSAWTWTGTEGSTTSWDRSWRSSAPVARTRTWR